MGTLILSIELTDNKILYKIKNNYIYWGVREISRQRLNDHIAIPIIFSVLYTIYFYIKEIT